MLTISMGRITSMIPEKGIPGSIRECAAVFVKNATGKELLGILNSGGRGVHITTVRVMFAWRDSAPRTEPGF